MSERQFAIAQDESELESECPLAGNGIVVKGMGVAKPLRPQPLAPYLTGIVAKGMGMAKGSRG
uniref:Uncharacterized protein n=1 Tax=Oryza punctata TaxID=4537 RepID=A0A0E0MHI6_ORYPU